MLEYLILLIGLVVGVILYPFQLSQEGLEHRAQLMNAAGVEEPPRVLEPPAAKNESALAITGWWKHAVIYHVYVRSFMDSNNDGVGDFQGLINRLDYLSTLGIDTIWLSPIHPSPNKDWGYDVSDYYAVNPEYGSMNDFDELVAQCAQRNIKIILDLVVNHTSEEHQWFKDAKSSREHAKRDWYIWRDGHGHNPPNNWQARPAGLGSSWKFDADSRQWYLCSFLEHQPDLNWRNEEVRNEVKNIMKFWLTRGVSGFRLDIANYFLKDEQFRDNPSGKVKNFLYGSLLGYEYQAQEHINDKNSVELIDVFRDLRTFADSFDAVLIGEIDDEEGHVGNSLMSAVAYGPNNDALHLSLNFDILKVSPKAHAFRKALTEWQSLLPKGAKAVYAFSNHDQKRAISRLGKKKARLFTVWQLTSDAVPIIYYGEEIGMRHGVISKDAQKDPLWNMAPKIVKYFIENRDGARTPMQWSNRKYGGFSNQDPWLPINPDLKVRNVEAQSYNDASTLSLYRKLLALRKQHAVLQEGRQEFLNLANKNVLGYRRMSDDEEIIGLLNFSSQREQVRLEEWAWVIFSTVQKNYNQQVLDVVLEPYEGILLSSISNH